MGSSMVRVGHSADADHLVVRVDGREPFDCYPQDLVSELARLGFVIAWDHPSVEEVLKRGGELAFRLWPMPRMSDRASLSTDMLLLDRGGGGYHLRR